MTPQQEQDLRADGEAAALLLMLAALKIIEQSLVKNNLAFVDADAMNEAKELIKKARDTGWLIIKDNGDGIISELVYAARDTDAYSDAAVALMVTGSIAILEAALVDVDAVDRVSTGRTVLRSRRGTRAESYAIDAVHGAVEDGKAKIIRSKGKQAEKTWRSVGDSRVRMTHRQANGQTVLVNDLFVVGSDLLDRPRDPRGSLKEIINCRCMAVYSEDWTK